MVVRGDDDATMLAVGHAECEDVYGHLRAVARSHRTCGV